MKPVHLLSAIFIAVALPRVSHSQTATFKFAPRLDTVCVETEERNITTIMSSGAGTKTVSSEHDSSVVERRFQKNGNEYFITEQTKKISGEIDGKPFENPINPVLLAVVPTNVVSKEGRLLHVLGDEQMVIQAEKIFPADAYPQIEAQLNTNVLEQVARSRWDDSIAVLVGCTVKQGEAWKNKTSSGDSRIHFKYIFPSIVQTKSNVVVTVLIFGSTDSNLLDKYKLENAKNLSSHEAKEFLDWTAVDSPLLKICVQQIMDANTMAAIAEDEIQQTISPAPEGLKIENERDSRSYQYKQTGNP